MTKSGLKNLAPWFGVGVFISIVVIVAVNSVNAIYATNLGAFSGAVGNFSFIVPKGDTVHLVFGKSDSTPFQFGKESSAVGVDLLIEFKSADGVSYIEAAGSNMVRTSWLDKYGISGYRIVPEKILRPRFKAGLEIEMSITAQGANNASNSLWLVWTGRPRILGW